MLDLALLGTGGMMPLPERHLTALYLRHNGNLFLVDCGEGTQVTVKILGWGFKNLGVICITHFHADHISGLPGMLLAVGNSGRTDPLTIIGPPGTKRVVESLRVIAPYLPFQIEYYEISKEINEFYFDGLKISAQPVKHSIPCFAYKFELDRQGKFNVEKAKEVGVPMNLWSVLQKGEDVEFDGMIIKPEMVMGEKRKGIKIAYSTDLRPADAVIDFVKDSELFICEGIYGEDELKEKAEEKGHCLFSEAATMAKEANVTELWLTHFSPSMPDPDQFLVNATGIFNNTQVGSDRMTKTLRFCDEE